MTGKNILSTVGRRKTSIARVRLFKGKGAFEVNGMDFKDYFERKVHRITVQKPLEVTDSLGQCDVVVSVSGGGKSGQAGAICHGVSRALLSLDSENRLPLKKNGFLTRDSRMVERKKYGRKGARKSFQFSKR